MCNWVFLVDWQLCGHCHLLIPESLPPLKTPTDSGHPLSPVPQPLTTTNLLSDSIDLLFLQILFNFNHTLCWHLWLTLLFRHNDSKVYPWVKKYSAVWIHILAMDSYQMGTCSGHAYPFPIYFSFFLVSYYSGFCYHKVISYGLFDSIPSK